MITAILVLIWAILGHIEAMTYALKGATSFARNEHLDLNTLRLMIVGAIVIGAVFGRMIPSGHDVAWMIAAEVAGGWLFLPMAHDEAYNLTRLWIIEAGKLPPVKPARLGWGNAFLGWRSDLVALRQAWARYDFGFQSGSTTASMDFSGAARVWLAAGGLSVLIGAWMLFRLG